MLLAGVLKRRPGAFRLPLGFPRLAATSTRKHAGEERIVSHVRAKLDYFLETGQTQRYSPRQLERGSRRAANKNQFFATKNAYSPQKALLVLRALYDNSIFQDENGEVIDLYKLSPSSLNVQSPTSLSIFKALHQVQQLKKRSTDKKLVFFLLGTNSAQIKDPFVVTKDVLKLLERDQEITRAVQLARLAGSSAGVVGMNAILQWLLERGDVKGAFKNFNDRKKWAIPSNAHTYTILFDGLAKCHEWGKVSNDLAQKCVQIFESFRLSSAHSKAEASDRAEKIAISTCSISHFNACLSVLVKNFADDQELAWSFFDNLIPSESKDVKMPTLVADSQTFTIFLNGIKRNFNKTAEDIAKSDKLTGTQKTAQLLENQAQLISTAQLILAKVMNGAMPPVPPTKEEAEADPELLISYRKRMKRILIDIDPAFVAVFTSCFINNSAGTSTNITAGSHYRYTAQGLTYLSMWSPEVKKMMSEIEELTGTTALFAPTQIVKSATDGRILHALESPGQNSPRNLESWEDALPELILPKEELQMASVNPMVVFPPPPLSNNKTRAIFSGKAKPLVDFSRPTSEDFRLYLLNKKYKDSRGKFGQKITKEVNLERKNGVNKFVMTTALDGLVKLGKHKEFYLGVWHVLTQYGGIHLGPQDLSEYVKDGTRGVLSSYPNAVESPGASEVREKRQKTPPYVAEGVDMLLVENFIYKIFDNYRKKDVALSHITDIFSALSNPALNVHGGLVPREKTIDVIFSVFLRLLYHFNDSNFNRGIIDKRRQNIPNNTPKKSITKHQLTVVLENLGRFMDGVIVHESTQFKHPRKSVMSNMFTASYNKILERLYASTWSDIAQASEDELTIHKRLLKSGVLVYRPKELHDGREKLIFATPLAASLEYVYNSLKNKDDLSKADRKLMLDLRDMFQLQSRDAEALNKLKVLSTNIYRNILSCTM